MSQDQQPLLKVTDLTREFPAGESTIQILKGINLEIYPGELVAIVGQSGSGKSTLMNILGCLDQPTSGSYQVKGRETRQLEADELAQLRREYFGFIFQRYHLLGDLTALGVGYQLRDGPGAPAISIADDYLPIDLADDAGRKAALQAALESRGFDFAKQKPPLVNLVGIVALLCALGLLSALTYGSVAALLSEMFPARIRYSSMSIPYHMGAGYLGGFLPLIAGYIVASTGNAYAGLWYCWGVMAFGLLVAWWGIPPGPPRDFEDSGEAPPVSPATI